MNASLYTCTFIIFTRDLQTFYTKGQFGVHQTFGGPACDSRKCPCISGSKESLRLGGKWG